VQALAAVSREGAEYPALETVEVEEPKAGEILVRVVACGICHTDISVHGGYGPSPKPIVLGHEGAGIVERVGDGVTTLAPGDHVVLGSNSCGHCASCRRNLPTYCDEAMQRNFGGRRPDGTTPLSQDGAPIHGRFFGQSSFSQFSLADEHAAIKVDRDLPLEILGPLGCGVHTGAGAVLNSFGVEPGHSIAIFGVGSVGLSAVMAARLAGAQRIIAIDVVPSRLALAAELGATATVDAKEDDPVQAVRKLAGDGIDFTLNTTGTPAVYTQAVECLGPRGVAGFVTSPRGEWTPDMFHILLGGRSVRGIVGGDSVPSLLIPLLIDYYRQGRFPLERLIRFYPFEEIADAFRDSQNGETIKAVLRIGTASG
jgi:aryl-alcohol dehydrogenase